MVINETDGLAGVGLLAFTMGETLFSGEGILELLTKFGTLAVLWFWLRDTKEQMQKQADNFAKQSTDTTDKFLQELRGIREANEKSISKLSEDHKVHSEFQNKLIDELQEDIKVMRDKIMSLTNSKKV